MRVPLTFLKAGETGIVTFITVPSRGGGPRGRGWGLRKRLVDMGLTPGTRVTVIKSAPFRGPMEILVRGSRLALGRGMAERVYVEIDR
ncbi:ferrous iron transport protein A [Candidatus Bathyarchaeota archaeon]|nr:MAG: ferrous iron transport protein A [Candidatus Bathyarchaeota archaeon ex4484_40]RJS77901.1 MAG: ferrous iron transport protein A [Candidatus Bathyarchaeota archaeon]RLG97012.1 MAG: ferrous iron transport protein A [Candidatus Bathyarchaeota archaeon]HDJ04445.1 ferrous iron transport protein A [Candidatus Bathyarchaeota archaeon]